MTAITIAPLARPIASGDWHDKPAKWQVNGPAQEVQQFSTRKDAELYARLRRKSSSLPEASRKFTMHWPRPRSDSKAPALRA